MDKYPDLSVTAKTKNIIFFLQNCQGHWLDSPRGRREEAICIKGIKKKGWRGRGLILNENLSGKEVGGENIQRKYLCFFVHKSLTFQVEYENLVIGTYYLTCILQSNINRFEKLGWKQ